MTSNIRQKDFIVLLLLLFGCCTNPKVSQSFQVEYKGALKNIMRKGDVAAKANLSDFKHLENLYALGAIGDLKGEIQIFDGIPYNSSVEADSLVFDESFTKSATLLVYATVREWMTVDLPANIILGKDLEKHLVKVASANNIDINQPFPFKIEGTVKKAKWHVINWKDGDKEHSHDKHISSGLNGELVNEPAEFIGFYSDSHHAIFTHHTTNMHIHMKSQDGRIAGHVDDFQLGENMLLSLPVNK